MRFFRALGLFFLFFFAFSDLSAYERQKFAKEQVLIEAAYLQYEKKEGVFKAEGDVKVTSGSTLFRASKIIYNEKTGELIAEGNVLFLDGEDAIECEKLFFHIEKRTGAIENGRILIKKGNYYVEGRSIERKGENEYCVKIGSITTCDPERPDWKFTAKNADIVFGGYAKLTGATFHVREKPVFYLPWGIFPVKTERETGLLMPELKISSRDGFVFMPSFFWAIDKDKDATFFLQLIEERGIKPQVEFRYAIREDKQGILFASIVDDKKFHHTRYELRGEHKETISDSFTFKTNVHYTSDIDYLKDFSEKSDEKKESLLRSNFFFEKDIQKSHLVGGISYFRDLRKKDNDETFKHLPFFSFFTDRIRLWNERLFFSLNSDLVNFYREKGEKYSRFNLEPSLSLARSISGINLMLLANYYGKIYLIEKEEEKNFKGVQNLKIEGSLNTHLERSYCPSRILVGKLQSFIKPELKWTYIPKRSFADIPYIDPSDRMARANVLTYSISHYLNMQEPHRGEISTFEIEQSFGIKEKLEPSTLYEGYGKRFSDVKAKLKLSGMRNIGFTNESVVNVYGGGIKRSKNELSYKFSENGEVSMFHTYTKDLAHEISLQMKGKVRDFHLAYQTKYSFFNKEWVETLYEINYSPVCWSLTLRLGQTKRPKETSIRLNFDLKGITDKSK